VSETPDWLPHALGVLRRAYAEGISHDEYLPLLAALYIDMSPRGLARLVAEFADREYAVVLNDANGVISAAQKSEWPSKDAVLRTWYKLLDNGWIPDNPLPRYQLPWLADEPAAVLRRAYPGGLPAEDYLLLLAALDADVGRHALAIIVTTAFPGHNATRVFFDAAQAGTVPETEVERVRQRLLVNGWTPSAHLALAR
jgi:hypothetical protein